MMGSSGFKSIFIALFVFQLCANSDASNVHESIRNFAKRIFSWGDAQPETSPTSTGTEIETTTPSYRPNHMSSPEDEPSSSLTDMDISLLKSKCPELQDIPNIHEYRYNDVTKKCQQLQWRGACGKNMIFYHQRGIYGECGCKVSKRIIVPHEASNQCYAIFTQGFCPEGQWVDITSELKPICVDNPCHVASNSSHIKDLVVVQGQCVEVDTKSSVCSNGSVVGFRWVHRKPSCIPEARGAIGVPKVKCPVGTVRAQNMKCVPPFDINDFDY